MATFTIRENHLNSLLANIIGITLLEKERFKDPTVAEIVNMVYPNIKVVRTTRNVSPTMENYKFHFLFQSDEDAIEFKMKYSEFLEP